MSDDVQRDLLRARQRVRETRGALNQAMHHLRAAWKAAGLCIQCGRPTAGKARCAYHLKQAREAAKALRQTA